MQCKTVVSLGLSILLGTQVVTVHAETEMTRQQVQAELLEALRMGDLPVNESGQRARDINPLAFPARPAVAGKTREQVRLELAEAIRLGEIPVTDSGLRPRDINPSFYPPEAR